MGLDEKIVELEKLSKVLESESIGLEEGVKIFENSVEIAKECMTALNETKGRVLQIKQDLETFKEEELK